LARLTPIASRSDGCSASRHAACEPPQYTREKRPAGALASKRERLGATSASRGALC
jgi:hypothetical protein